MSESKFKKVMEILEKVNKINTVKGAKLVIRISEDFLDVYDTENSCKPVMDYRGYTNYIYFDEVWEEHFNGMVEEMNKALDQYLV